MMTIETAPAWHGAPLPGNDQLELRLGGSEAARAALSLDVAPALGGALRITVTALTDTAAAATVTVRFPHTFGVALYQRGIAQRDGDFPRHATSSTGLIAAYSMSPHDGSCSVEIVGSPRFAVSEWSSDGFRAHFLLAGMANTARDTVIDGSWDLASEVDTEVLSAGESRTLVLRVTRSEEPTPALFEDAVGFSDSLDLRSHRVALWGSQVPAFDTLQFPGATYPTLHAPDRAYGSLHTFFDPDAWSSSVAVAFSGVPYLQEQAMQVVERATRNMREDGLVPHHFDGEEPEYVAISGSPQPGPNLFLVEAAIDITCATGNVAWFRAQWHNGIRRALEWLLDRMDERHGLLSVTGALWVDVFRRAGLTLDTNAMAVRTFARAADAARAIGDPFADRLEIARDTVRSSLSALWDDDHFITSIDPDTGDTDDHIDSENFLAIATGAATDDQAARIVTLFDSSPLTHPRGRGTWVSLRRYEPEDCYLENTGDSDIAMARHWWADLLARRALGDDETFTRLLEPIRADLLEHVWMTERYDAEGAFTRADGYHEYPDLLDYLLREGLYGLSLDLGAVLIAPMRRGPFSAHWGGISYAYAQEEVSLSLPDELMRSVEVRGLIPNAAYEIDNQAFRTDSDGVLRASMCRRFVATLLPAGIASAAPGSGREAPEILP